MNGGASGGAGSRLGIPVTPSSPLPPPLVFLREPLHCAASWDPQQPPFFVVFFCVACECVALLLVEVNSQRKGWGEPHRPGYRNHLKSRAKYSRLIPLADSPRQAGLTPPPASLLAASPTLMATFGMKCSPQHCL